MSSGWTFEAIAAAIDGVIESGDPGRAWEPGQISFDTRRLRPGDVFIALRGDRDGHDFLEDAVAKGAAGAVVERDRPLPDPPAGFVRVRVADSLAALGAWAAAHRSRCCPTIVAVTGSSGKTTTKDRLFEILSREAPTLATEGNLNNHIGVPITLLALEPEHRFAVIEIAMNHPGEIAPLSRLVRPDHVVVTTVGWAHIGALGTREAILAEKLSVTAGLRRGGTLFHEYDPWLIDRLTVEHRALQRVTFGLAADADLHPQHFELLATGTRFSSRYTGEVLHPCPGRGALKSALAACAVARALGVLGTHARDALASASPRPLRMEPRQLGPALAVLDCYNASPESSLESVAFLSEIDTPGRRWLAFGEMRELGARSEEAHRRLGEAAGGSVDGAFFLGDGCAPALDAYMHASGGRGVAVLHQAGEHEAIARELVARIREGDVVLFKGSRASTMERAFDLCAQMLAMREGGHRAG